MTKHEKIPKLMATMTMPAVSKPWGWYEDKEVRLYSLRSDSLQVTISNFGATVCSILVKDEEGRQQNIVLGYETLQQYIDDPYYVGCTVGRMAGRIGGARFEINGTPYALAANGGNGIHLHGGNRGFGKRVFSDVEESASTLTLHYRSPHLEEGYPGNLDLFVSFVVAENSLTISYKSFSDQDTHLNLTNHSYFNLGGPGTSVLEHQLTVGAGRYVATGPDFIPTSDICPVRDTVYDFREQRRIAAACNECFVLDHSPAAVLRDPHTGRSLSLETDCPALLLYTGDFLGLPFYPNAGVCLETQFYPDSPRHPLFPSTLLRAGETRLNRTTYSFK